jgi:hypothetical protein
MLGIPTWGQLRDWRALEIQCEDQDLFLINWVEVVSMSLGMCMRTRIYESIVDIGRLCLYFKILQYLLANRLSLSASDIQASSFNHTAHPHPRLHL